MSLCIVGPTQADAQAWAGFVESQLRKLVSDLLARSLPLRKIQLWPKKFEACIADKNALLTVAQRQNCITYFVGFQVDKFRMRGTELNVELPLYNFREYNLSRYTTLVTGMDLMCKTFSCKELPKLIFDGKKAQAMAKRRRIRDADPQRQEKKRLARLEELKEKMEEMKRKKEDKKRKREEVELVEAVEEEAAIVTKQEEEAEEEEENQETDQLESALDVLLQGEETAKTREEAEEDRQKLLAGELLVEGDGSDDEEAGYMGDGARRVSFFDKKDDAPNTAADKRSLPVRPEEAEVLKKLGYAIVSDDECKILGTDMLPPWRAPKDDNEEEDSKPKVNRGAGKITFLTKFDVVELDAHGHVIDKGDDDFTPRNEWTGRKAGFEFKMGERGLGYYRTGKKVVVPSNTAY